MGWEGGERGRGAEGRGRPSREGGGGREGGREKGVLRGCCSLTCKSRRGAIDLMRPSQKAVIERKRITCVCCVRVRVRVWG